jgi:hypothetical protein
MYGHPPAWVVVLAVAGVFGLPLSVIVPLVGLKLWEWWAGRDAAKPDSDFSG